MPYIKAAVERREASVPKKSGARTLLAKASFACRSQRHATRCGQRPHRASLGAPTPSLREVEVGAWPSGSVGRRGAKHLRARSAKPAFLALHAACVALSARQIRHRRGEKRIGAYG